MGNESRRKPPLLPDLAVLNWADIRGALYRYLRWVNDFYASIPGGWKNTAPEQIQAGVTAAAGTEAASWASADHVHDVDTAAPGGLANSNSEGTGSALMRASAGIKRDVRVQLAGADVGTRNAISFSTDFLPVDNPGADRVDVAFSGPGFSSRAFVFFMGRH